MRGTRPSTLDRFSCGHPVELFNCCARDFLSWFDFEGDELVYFDPPWLQATRRSGRRYRYDYDDEDHVELLRLLKSLPCRVIFSGFPASPSKDPEPPVPERGRGAEMDLGL